jgi:N-acetylmuramic acid 6-phosphate etherase
MLAAVEGAEDDRSAGEAAAADLTAADLAFGITASGRTPWVIGALDMARRRGAATVGLSCVPKPAVAPHVEVMLVADTGPEAVAGSTRMKAGTAQKLVLNAFSTALMVRLGKVYANLMVDVQATNRKLRRRAVRLIEQAVGVDTASAERALDDSAGEVKTAIARLRLQISTRAARERLRRVDGDLRRALDER